jgi:hypothetical protein
MKLNASAVEMLRNSKLAWRMGKLKFYIQKLPSNMCSLIILLMIIDVAVGIYYIFHKDFARTLYWFCAAVLSGTTMFMK